MNLSKVTRAGVFALAICLLMSGCAKHAPTLTPAQNIQLTGDQALDILANSANGAEKSAYALEAAKLISTATARSVGNYSKEASQVAQKALAINQGTTTTVAQKATAVIALLQTIKQLPADVQGFVNNPTADATVQALVTLVQTIVNTAKGLLASQGAN